VHRLRAVLDYISSRAIRKVSTNVRRHSIVELGRAVNYWSRTRRSRVWRSIFDRRAAAP
jgi:hypothetical protein